MLPTSRTLKLIAALATTAAVALSQAQALQDIKSPSGSEIVYGALKGYSSLDDGLVYILKQVHGHYGSKPELGSFFKAKSGESVGTFFSVQDKNFTHQKQSGLVLVSKLADGTVQAAVLTDLESQFKNSINGMLQQVQAAWNPDQAQPTQTFNFPDGSGSIDLAAGWHPLVARGGGVIATGPSREMIAVSCYLAVLDANNPRVRMQLESGRPLPGHYAAAPLGMDPAQVFGTLYNQWRQKFNMPQGQVNVKVVKQQPDAGGTGFTLAGDFEDPQTGKQQIVAVMHASSVNPRLGGWSCMMTTVTAPRELFSKECRTLFAMTNSLKQNGQVIQQQGDEASIAIRNYGESVRKATQAKSDAFDDYMKSIGQMHDGQDKQSSAFQDLQLDQAVVENTATGEHKRFYNDDAYNLVQANPDKYQIVPGSQYIKGKDY